MKITKKMRKKARGMNAATREAYQAGHRPAIYSEHGTKTQAGIPFVNHMNFPRCDW